MAQTVKGIIGQVKIGTDQYLVGSTLFGTSSTGSTDGTKQVILVGEAYYSDATGITIHVKFDNANTVTDSTLKLQIQTGASSYSTAQPIVNPNGALTWAADSIISFTNDGTNWVINASAIDGSSIQNLSLGNITNEGKLSTASSLVVTDTNKKITTGVAFTNTVSSQDQTTTFLRSDGTWAAPSYTADTHHTATLITADEATDKSTAAGGTNSVYLNLVENNTVRSSHQIVGAGGTTVASDANGKITITGQSGTVTSVQVQATSPVVSSTSTASSTTLNTTISLADGYGDTKNPYGTKTANYILAGPSSGNAAAPSFRALVEADIPSEIARLASPTFTGTPLITTTPTSGDNSHKIADTAFVAAEISSKLAANDAMLFKGTIGTGGTITAVPDGTSGKTYQAGYTYRVITAGTYAGYVCEIGDLLIAVSDSTSGQTEVNNNHWTVAQTNIDGALYKGTTYTSGQVLIASNSGAVNTTGITITSEATGFTISGGTTSKTLTVTRDITLGNAAGKTYTDSSSASAIGTGTTLVTERDVYYGLPQINHTHTYTSSDDFYAPTSGGTAGQYLKAGGENTAPTWETFGPGTVGLGNVTDDAQIPKSIGTTAGDTIYWSSANAPERLGIGTSGQVLTVSSSGVPEWAANSATDEKVKIINNIPNVNGATSSSTFNIIFGQPTENDASATTQYYNNGLQYITYSSSTASNEGKSILILGNNLSSSSTGDLTGVLTLYASNGKSISLTPASSAASNQSFVLPYVGSGSGRIVGAKGTSAIGSSSQPVYITAAGMASAIDYTIEANVPSGAVFTDHQYSASTTDVLNSLTLAYNDGSEHSETPSTASFLAAVTNGVLYIKSLVYGTTSVNTGFGSVT